MPNDEPVLDIERRSKEDRHLAGEVVAKLPYRRKDAWGVLHGRHAETEVAAAARFAETPV